MAMGKLKKWFSDDEGEDTSRLDDDFYTVSEEEALKEADKTGNKMILLEPQRVLCGRQIFV